MLFEEHLTDLGSGNNIGIASNININNAKASIPDTSGASNISDSSHMKKADIITSSLFAKSSSGSSKSGEPWVLCDDASWKYYQEESLAYKAQNKMLNQEIIELNDLVCSLETKLDESQICVTKLEASLNHMNNKFWKCYFDLNELCTNEVAIVTSDKLKQIFEDSLQADDSDSMFDRMRSKQGPVYDQYGFEKTLKREATFTQANDGSENNEQQSAMKSEMIKMKQKSQQDMNLILKWETMLISLERCLTFKNKETKMMIRDGVPSQFRARLWK
ncbi:hypothetical protein HELRODRAFT_103485, partial [Helobdella robusta]|uniref:Uncharacterized protein n=1 Tax=Helobdella robusta TaxID=6412 RepID=T1EDG4_HELRO